ncbi:MAG: GntR family transcriptional regulator, partial [Bacteroidetes bacterium]
MIKIGEYNTLTILREKEPGLFLSDEEDSEVLLPNRYVPNEFKIWDKLEVFVYLDNEERLVAVTDKPYITKGEFAVLRCNQVSEHGAFLDWGMVKELFCPFKEQAFKMKKGGWYLVYCYLDDKTNRLVASSKTNTFLSNQELTVSPFEEVDLIVSHPSEIGMNVIVNKKHL